MAMHQRPEKLTTHLPTSDIREKNQSELQQHQSTPVIIMSSDDASASPASEQSNNPKSNPPPSQVAAIAAATSRASAAVSTTATPKDVVGGRGKNTRLHPGNLFYTKLLKERYDEYKQAPKGSKMDICKRIIALVNEQGGRFLEKAAAPAVSLSASTVSSTSSLYTELEEERVIAKVAQGFRDLKVNKEKSTVGNSSWNGGASSVISKQSKKKFGKKGFISPLGRTIVAAPPVSSVAVTAAAAAAAATEHNKNGTLSAQQQQPRRMSFTERAKLFQKEQEKLLRIQRGEDVSSDDEDEEEEASDDDEEEGDDDAASDQEDAANANEAKNDNKLPPSGVRFPTYGEGEDVSDTETEDSFPMYRGDKKSG